MLGSQAALGRHSEQIGTHDTSKELLLHTRDVIQTGVIRVGHGPGLGDARLASQEHQSAEIASRVQ
ncbi:MAG: hypothetical protein OXE96_00235 [Gemmatimonadetes bacterium]|nr:hypothetical protein [Gemmatimonadota bacterium]